MKPLALSSLFVVLAAVGCNAGAEKKEDLPTPGAPVSGSTDAGAATASFASAKDVFAANCIGCHSGPGAKEGVDFSTHESIMKGGEHGPVVVAGDPAGSLVMKALRGNGAKQMPPGKTIPEDKIQLIEAWIKAGAKAE